MLTYQIPKTPLIKDIESFHHVTKPLKENIQKIYLIFNRLQFIKFK